MERDFMGLAVKQEISEEFTDAVPSRSSPMQWPFLQKGSSLLSSHGVQEEKPTAGFEYSITSTRSGTLNTTEAFDSSQKNIVNENQGGVRYTMINYPTKHLDTYAFHRPITNQTFSPSPTTSTHLAMRSNSPLVGTTDLRNASNVAGGAPQLTIFYNGSVCVYDDVAPEKAQAIMLLAGNGSPTTSNATLPPASVQTPVPRPNVLDRFVTSQSYSPTPTPPPAPVQTSVSRSNVLDRLVTSQSYSPTPTPHCLSPAPLNSICVSQSVSRPNAGNDTNVSKLGGVTITSSNNAGPLRVVDSIASVATTTCSSAAVPQFRQKSLARFLEKRKERVLSANPYAGKQS